MTENSERCTDDEPCGECSVCLLREYRSGTIYDYDEPEGDNEQKESSN